MLSDELMPEFDEQRADAIGQNGNDGGHYALTQAYRAKVDEIEAMPSEPDMVNAPPHYRQGAVECIDAIRAALTAEEFRGYCKGNALKYIWRERHKGGDESLAKANWYLHKL